MAFYNGLNTSLDTGMVMNVIYLGFCKAEDCSTQGSPCSAGRYGQLNPGMHQKEHGWQAEGGDSPPLLCPCATLPGALHPVLQHVKDVDMLERAMRMTRGKLHPSYRLRELWLCSLGKRGLQGDFIGAFQCLKGAFKKGRERKTFYKDSHEYTTITNL